MRLRRTGDTQNTGLLSKYTYAPAPTKEESLLSQKYKDNYI